MVSIHAPAGGATRDPEDFRKLWNVSIHAPAGGATVPQAFGFRLSGCFNSRSRGGSDCKPRSRRFKPRLFQFTLPRGERRLSMATEPASSSVSIHAPAGGATGQALGSLPKYIQVSIHAPAGGATPLTGTAIVDAPVSIHAPAGGATRILFAEDATHLFQFTLPRGERLRHRPYIAATKLGFNSRSRGGSDRNARFSHGELLQVSIHAPAGGATERSIFTRGIAASFNSRSRGGSDFPSMLKRFFPVSFNSRSRGGSDTRRAWIFGISRKFQFTLPRGERHDSGIQPIVPDSQFQFTLPRGERLRAGTGRVPEPPHSFNSRSRGGSD